MGTCDYDLIGMKELGIMLGKGSKRGETVARSYAHHVSRDRSFPEPVAEPASGRLWRRRDVEAWLDQHRPKWREGPAADETD
jgi:hypothetical protein